MTNQEYLLTLSAEECYKMMDWLFFDYGRDYTSTELAIIDWLKDTCKMEGRAKTMTNAYVVSVVTPSDITTNTVLDVFESLEDAKCYVEGACDKPVPDLVHGMAEVDRGDGICYVIEERAFVRCG